MLGWWRTIAGLLRAELQRSERCGTGGTELEKGGGERRLEVWNGDSEETAALVGTGVGLTV